MMNEIHKKIVFDENNKPTEVIISYDEWIEVEKIISFAAKQMTRKKLYKYSGIITLEEDPLEYQKRIRNEWH